ncbi:MFS general substrate transporter [Lichtheimia hyalospora FSU 10163]|nr:MFS general substrate transporter [Lichtheimia hyalospora FSU 10163]
MSSTIYFPGIPYIAEELDASPLSVTLTTALYILLTGIAPVFWGSISDHYQIRRPLVLASLVIFCISTVAAGVVSNIWALVVLRCVQATGASCTLAVGAGIIADCYPVEERGAAFSQFFYGLFVGPLIGPVVGGGLIMLPSSWRATFWFLSAYGLCILLAVFVVLPETYRVEDPSENGIVIDDVSSTSTKSDEELGYCKKDEKAISDANRQVDSTTPKVHLMNPLEPFFMLRHPFVLMASTISGVAFGAMYAVETIMPSLYQQHFDFVAWQTGLTFLGAGLGNTLGTVINSMSSDRLLLRSRRQRGGEERVEDRLTLNLWPSGLVIVPLGLLLFGWPIVYNLSYWYPIIGFSIQNIGMVQLMTLSSAYLVDAMPGRGATSAAAANLMRNTFAAVLTLVSNPMSDTMGPGWTTVLLAALTWGSMGLLLLLKLYGPRLRQWSGYT